jgi:hypothetical protein
MAIPLECFPNLAGSAYSITSPPSTRTNCIAWAVEVVPDWWWPDEDGIGTWPEGVVRAETVEAFLAAFRTRGYEPCATAEREPGWQKIALYALDGIPTHAARQLPDGRWTSKLGPAEDIEHDLEALVGPLYGTVIQVLRRPDRAS